MLQRSLHAFTQQNLLLESRLFQPPGMLQEVLQGNGLFRELGF